MTEQQCKEIVEKNFWNESTLSPESTFIDTSFEGNVMTLAWRTEKDGKGVGDFSKVDLRQECLEEILAHTGKVLRIQATMSRTALA